MESQAHINLVNVALEYIKTIIPQDDIGLLQIDSAGNESATRTNRNYVPDIYYCYADLLVIGEAKTIDDFERLHSKEQFQSYIDECNSFSGDSILVISIPWQLVPKAKNQFRRMKNNQNIKTRVIIINEMGRRFEV